MPHIIMSMQGTIMTNTKSCGKVVIIGSGSVGSSAAFALAIGDVVNEIKIVDINTQKAKGEALDISHGLSLVGSTKVNAGGFEDVKDADVIVITAGSPRKPGETRLDLLKKNETIAREITKNIMKFYNNGIILVISNPVDILTYIIQKESGLPTSKVFGSGTMLDSSRFRYLIGENFTINVTDISGFLIGEHGESVVPIWSLVNIQGIPLNDFCTTYNKSIDKEKIEEEIRAAGAKVIQFKGATYYAIAIIIGHLVKAIVKNQNAIFPISSVIDGPYTIKDVALSLPSVVNSTGIQQVIEVSISNTEYQRLLASSDKLKSVLASL